MVDGHHYGCGFVNSAKISKKLHRKKNEKIVEKAVANMNKRTEQLTAHGHFLTKNQRNHPNAMVKTSLK